MQYCSLQQCWTLLPSPVTSTTGHCFCFGSVSSFFLELFLHWSPVAHWAPTDLGSSFFSVLSFCFLILFMRFPRQEYWSGLPFPFPVDHVLSELSTMTHPSWVALHGMAHCFTELEKLWSMWSGWLVFCDCGFQSVSPLMEKDKRLMEGSWWESDWGGNWVLFWWVGSMISKSLIQISVDGWSCVPSLLFTFVQAMVEVMKIMATSINMSHACTATVSAPSLLSMPLLTHASTGHYWTL